MKDIEFLWNKFKNESIKNIASWEPSLGITEEEDLRSILGVIATFLFVEVTKENKQENERCLAQNIRDIVKNLKQKNIEQIKDKTFKVEYEVRVEDLTLAGVVVKDQKRFHEQVIPYVDFEEILKKNK